ncbi:hypothetical protein UPYG_G00016000 [Umbra pygmaea]|uniref:Uncharacterized protein n=1 Tax=Umbra pygmaea TaxID=75934 RepID=A0ABD0XMS7_UMBPY
MWSYKPTELFPVTSCKPFGPNSCRVINVFELRLFFLLSIRTRRTEGWRALPSRSVDGVRCMVWPAIKTRHRGFGFADSFIPTR